MGDKKDISMNDESVSSISNDLLQIKEYINGLKSFVSTCETPMTMSIQGKWGAGKSSIMQLLQNALEGKDDSDSKSSKSKSSKATSSESKNSKRSDSNGTKQVIKTLYFNTWQYSQVNENLYENFITYLISNIVESTVKTAPHTTDTEEKPGIKKLASRILNSKGNESVKQFPFSKEELLSLLQPIIEFGISKAPLSQDFRDLLHKESEAVYKQILSNRLSQIELLDEYKKKFSDLIQKVLMMNENAQKDPDSPANSSQKAAAQDTSNSRFVFFIDDLDRLSPDQALSLLEIIKLFLDVPNCVFILAIDYDVVIEGVRRKYGDNFSREKGQEFFDKIIQVPFNVPTYTYKIDKLMKAGIDKDILDHFDQVVSFTSKCTENNPRTIKRILNSYNLMKAIFGYKDQPVEYLTCLYLIQCIQHTYNELYVFLIQNLETIIENLDADDSNTASDDTDLDVEDLELFLKQYALSLYRENRIKDIYKELIINYFKSSDKSDRSEFLNAFTETLNHSAQSNNITSTNISVSRITLKSSSTPNDSHPVKNVTAAFCDSVSFILDNLKPTGLPDEFSSWLIPNDTEPKSKGTFRAQKVIHNNQYIIGTSSSSSEKMRVLKNLYRACAADGVSIEWANNEGTVFKLPLN